MILGLASVDLGSFLSCLWLWPVSVPLNSLRLCSKPATASQHTNTAACTLQQQPRRRAASRRAGPRVLARWGRPGHVGPGSAQRQQTASSTTAGRRIYRRAASPGRQVAARGTPLMPRGGEAGGGNAEGVKENREVAAAAREFRVSRLPFLWALRGLN